MRVQIIVVQANVQCAWIPSGAPVGTAHWVSRAQARHLVELGIAKLPGPMEQPRAGPSETKAAVPRKLLRRSDDWPIDRFAVIEPVWSGETVVCIGGGPSVRLEEVQALRGRARVIAINDAYLLAPFADVCYFADHRWWDWHHFGKHGKPKLGLTKEMVGAAFAAFPGQKCTIEPTGISVADPEVFMLHQFGWREQRSGFEGFSNDPRALATGLNGGYQALNLAVLSGARTVLLYGYDMRDHAHWHDGHPVPATNAADLYVQQFRKNAPAIRASGAAVINCTPGSALDVFPFSTLDAMLS